ncbi:threonine synthase [Candidatus Xianfuyuplasma coldseepsis]|uniref:Threonine synthase n=1 Tax=Candidatus Xianfuyuplasma coldseepsis TaxID=2782163 RepID=A0A7L7KPN7_9MOLU|nr:threonine synthase [Xianfuyuplasma coldseepsis]QMS84399.1 threonine synthase [Xianfuyuplasma coldseepsis]
MTYVNGYQCTLCHTTFSNEKPLNTCPNCGDTGILDVRYDYNQIQQTFTKETLANNSDATMLRYLPLLPIEPPKQPYLQVGNTPLYPSTSIGPAHGLNHLYFKDETVNPTASLKDRASLIACLRAIEEGQNTVCCSSTGNAASSLAGNAAKCGLESVIFVPKRAPIGKLTQLVMYGSRVIQVQGDYKQTFELSQQAIDTYNMYNRNAAINPHLVEGKKTVALEIAEQLEFSPIDYVYVSVGDGCTIGGVYKGFYDFKQLGFIDTIPKIIGVQAEGCAPLYDAFFNQKDVEETTEDTFADSIAVGKPRNPIKALQAVTKSKGTFLTVRDQEIKDAMILLGKSEGIFAEPAGATALAGLIKHQRQGVIQKDDVIVVLITGNGLKDPNSVADIVQDKLFQINPSEAHSMKDNPTIEGFLHTIHTRGERHE